MNIASQPAVTYSYDKAGRLIAIDRGASRVEFVLDGAGRRRVITLPDGISENYAFDHAGQTSGISYHDGSRVLGNLSYGYDADGRVTSQSGTWARTNLPSQIGSATYNANNELTNWGGTHLAYDANGSLIGDGQNRYTWNARGQLTGISGGTHAAFTYDALGQRIKATIGGHATSYLYDAPNVTLEKSESSTGIVEGPSIDQYYAIGAGAKQSSLLTDRLGSTTAVASSKPKFPLI